MGRRGPIPQSNVVKLLKGNPGKRRLDKNQPQLPPPPGGPTPPRRIRGAAAEEWNRLYGQLVEKGIVHVGNFPIFEEYCFALGQLKRCENLSIRCSAESAIMIGLFRTAATLRQQVRQLARDLGLTVFVGEQFGADKKPESKLAKFIARPAPQAG